MRVISKNNNNQVDRLRKMEKKKIPDDIEYSEIHGIATEAKQKLSKFVRFRLVKHHGFAGVTPSDISILLVYLEHYNQSHCS